MYYRSFLINPRKDVYTYRGENTNELKNGKEYEILALGNASGGIDVRYGPEEHQFIRYDRVSRFLRDWHPIYVPVLDTEILKHKL